MKRSFNEGFIINIGYKADFESIAKRACFRAETESHQEDSCEYAPMEIDYFFGFEDSKAGIFSFTERKKRLMENKETATLSHKTPKTTRNDEDDDDLMEVDETVNGVAPMEVEGEDFYFTPMDIGSDY